MLKDTLTVENTPKPRVNKLVKGLSAKALSADSAKFAVIQKKIAANPSAARTAFNLSIGSNVIDNPLVSVNQETLPAATVDEAPKSNKMLYVYIVVGGLVLVAILYFVLRKK